jgi:hypothetical protein
VVLPPDLFFQVIEDPYVITVEPEPITVNIIQGEDWRAPIMAYIHHHYKPDINIELIRIQQRVKPYQIIGHELCRGKLAKVLWATGYGPKLLDTTSSLSGGDPSSTS